MDSLSFIVLSHIIIYNDLLFPHNLKHDLTSQKKGLKTLATRCDGRKPCRSHYQTSFNIKSIDKHVVNEEKVSDSLTRGLPVIPADPGIEVMAT